MPTFMTSGLPLPASDPRPISSTTFEGSASAITGISDASHCWNGLATKYPSDVNHRVNGASILISFHCELPEESVEVV
jgi:hypothetical protein